MGGYRGARVAADLTSQFTKLESPTMKRCGEKRGPPSVMPPNKRLKLAGGDRSKGSGALCADAHELSFSYTAPCGHVARSLSAIR